MLILVKAYCMCVCVHVQVDGITRATLYIQAPEHSNLMLLLVADSQLEREEETVRCLVPGFVHVLLLLLIALAMCYIVSSGRVLSFTWQTWLSI